MEPWPLRAPAPNSSCTRDGVFGHILDPRTGWPAEGVLSVTVLAPTAAEADALSTAFYVMGPNKADKYCQQHPHVSALMLCPAERAGASN